MAAPTGRRGAQGLDDDHGRTLRVGAAQQIAAIVEPQATGNVELDEGKAGDTADCHDARSLVAGRRRWI